MRGRRVPSHYAVTGFLLLLACYGYFMPKFENVNSSSRMDLVYAVADQGTLRIDDFHRNTSDKAFFRGHYYTEKAIGTSVLGLPVYTAFRSVAVPTGLVEPPETTGDGRGYSRRYHGTAVIIVTFLTVSIPSAAAASLLYTFVRRWVAPRTALVLMLAYGLGTIAFPYSSQFYAHQLATASMFAAFFLLWRVVQEDGRPAGAWAAGALIGFAIISEYVMVFVAVLLLAWVVHEQRHFGLAARVGLACLPWLALHVAYNLAAFGSVLPIGYAHTVYYTDVHAQGFMGMTAPSWERLYGITFSPYRGLFFLSPFLLLAAGGLVLMWRAGERSLAVLVAAVWGSMFLYNASYVVWSGGYAIGPRHLIPILPFLAVPVAWVLQRAAGSRVLAVAAGSLIVLSVVFVGLETIGGWDFPPENVPRPLTQYSIPALRDGDVSLNAGMALGLNGLASLLPLIPLVAAIALLVPRGVERLESVRRRAEEPATAAVSER